MIRSVVISPSAMKQLAKCPLPIRQKLFVWVAAVESRGVEEVRKQTGWHDEPLKGQRQGQRSIRLNRQWRAIYIVTSNGSLEFCEVREVTPHDY
jgi:toxin HigB-1